jgi:hypothetical protein
MTRPDLSVRSLLCRAGATKFLLLLLFSLLQTSLCLFMIVLVRPEIAEFCRCISVPNSVMWRTAVSTFKQKQHHNRHAFGVLADY